MSDDPFYFLEQIVPLDEEKRLFLSGAIDNWEPVHKLGITTLIDLEGDIDHGVPTAADEFLYIYLPIHDGALPQLDRLHAIASLGAELVRKGHRVLSHCGMGLNRSALVAGLILMQTHGFTGDEVVKHLQSRRRGALYNDVFADYLRSL